MKHIKFHRFLAKIVIALLFFSCGEKSEKNNPFRNYFNFSEEILRLEKENPVVLKTIEKNGRRELISATVNWKNELQLFAEANINKPQLRDGYEIWEMENGKWLSTENILREPFFPEKVKYIAKEKKLPVQHIEISYKNRIVTEIFIQKSVNNFLTKSYYELHYFPEKGYSISAHQSMLFLSDEFFLVEGRFLVPKEGKWRAALKIPKENEEIPFYFNLQKNNENYTVEILNAEEKIFCSEVSVIGDSIFIKPPVFDSELKGKFFSDTLIEGAWFNYSKGSDYIMPFYAEYGNPQRFKIVSTKNYKKQGVAGKWEAGFSAGTKDFYKAVGIFNSENYSSEKITGTFLTETGDYRFLEGVFAQGHLLLSCFDGSHAFLFKAKIEADSNYNPDIMCKYNGIPLQYQQLSGMFYSGIHWKEPFIAKRNQNAKLTNPDSLTFLKNGKIEFSFPDLDSNIISLSDKKFQGRAVIVSIMGSWCPNCLDETVFLSELYKNYQEKGLEIVALCFERSAEFSKAKQAVERFKKELNANYYFLIAGTASTKNANEKLPMLNKIISFPTTIYIDRNGKVRKIYTGFYGPGTGEYYSKFKVETFAFIEKLLRE